MTEAFWLDREAFLKIAELSGLDMRDRRMEDLYSFIQSFLPSFKDIERLDLSGMEPFLPTSFPKEGAR
jgi:Asp-tRNA(Asn)/Glu-tRNA(Gln) amidotransferase C subunit